MNRIVKAWCRTYNSIHSIIESVDSISRDDLDIPICIIPYKNCNIKLSPAKIWGLLIFIFVI